MSPLHRQSTIFLQSELTEELNSGPSWLNGDICSAFREVTSPLLEDVATSFEGSPAPSIAYLFPSFDDDHLGPPAASEDVERVGFVTFPPDACPIPFGNQPDDLYATLSLSPSLSIITIDPSLCSFDPTYQVTYAALFHNDHETCVPAQTTTIYGIPPSAPAPRSDSVTTITQNLAATHLPSTPVDPSTMTAYAPFFHYGSDSSQVPSTPGTTSIAFPPPISSAPSSPRCDCSESDGEGDTDHIPPSDDDQEYRPTQAAPSRKQKKRKATPKTKSLSTSSKSEKSVTSSRARRRSHPYKRRIPSRNFQSEDGAMRIERRSSFRCPVVGCDHVQKNHRVPDLNRHIATHDRWLEPEKWTCCGVTMDVAWSYDTGIERGMTRDEQIQAGAYLFKGQLMIGGCLDTFARRDALKRHVDNPNIPCVGHMESYSY